MCFVRPNIFLFANKKNNDEHKKGKQRIWSHKRKKKGRKDFSTNKLK